MLTTYPAQIGAASSRHNFSQNSILKSFRPGCDIQWVFRNLILRPLPFVHHPCPTYLYFGSCSPSSYSNKCHFFSKGFGFFGSLVVFSFSFFFCSSSFFFFSSRFFCSSFFLCSSCFFLSSSLFFASSFASAIARVCFFSSNSLYHLIIAFHTLWYPINDCAQT